MNEEQYLKMVEGFNMVLDELKVTKEIAEKAKGRAGFLVFIVILNAIIAILF